MLPGVRAPGLLPWIQVEPLQQVVTAAPVESAAQPAHQVDHLAAGDARPQGDIARHVRQPGTQRDTVCPRISTQQPDRPRVGAQQPSSTRIVVVLPEPFGPRKPCTSPVATSRSSPSKAVVGPKVLTKPVTKIAGVIRVSRCHWSCAWRCPRRLPRMRGYEQSVSTTIRRPPWHRQRRSVPSGWDLRTLHGHDAAGGAVGAAGDCVVDGRNEVVDTGSGEVEGGLASGRVERSPALGRVQLVGDQGPLESAGRPGDWGLCTWPRPSPKRQAEWHRAAQGSLKPRGGEGSVMNAVR